jgi:hypothetical protein
MGMYVGTGDQDNYLKLVVTANGGSPGVQLVKEVAGNDTVDPVAPVTLPGPDAVDLYLTIDPSTGITQASYRLTTGGVAGPLVTLAGTETVPSGWLTSSTQGLAVGVIATSAGGPRFPATWSALDATLGAPS